ncbi:MAG: TonB-dependent receptor plug domain-containing protein [Desulfuromonas sp.]|nr:TonB-dependent receptor plug domain-containing protein [Desulfuromonas sp.]
MVDDTMSMLVGETAPITTVADRHPEAANTAPAMLLVIDRSQIDTNGWRTLAELLSDQPGFFMAGGGRGTLPYLRGMKNSVLFLYDGVPITTDVTKNYAALDGEISLNAIERVEIVRGAGSVLWGADAFAGVVNIVPRLCPADTTLATNLFVGDNNTKGGDFLVGQRLNEVDYSLFYSTTKQRFHDYHTTADSAGEENSSYNEFVGNLNISNWFHLSGRWSEFERHYTMNNANDDLSWAGEKDAPFNYLKMAINHEYGASHYSLNAFVQQTDYRVLDAGIERQQRNRMYHAELLWDRRVFNRGLFSLGGSVRHNQVDGAVVNDGFLPDFFQSQQTLFTPYIEQEDFSNRLLSLFSQLRYRWGRSQLWAGVRFDEHNSYGNNASYSIGFSRPLTSSLDFKLVYGTAYRTPYSVQLVNDQTLTPEVVRTLTAQCNWSNAEGTALALTLFYSNLKDLRYEDPYGGLSEPVNSKVYGGEFTASFILTNWLTVKGALSVTAGDDSEAEYSVLNYSYIRPDMSQVDVFDTWAESFDPGPDWMAHAGVTWKPSSAHQLTLNARVGGSYKYSYQKGEVQGHWRQPLIIDACYRYSGKLIPTGVLQLRCTNLFNRHYQQPDIYGPVDAAPFEATLMWNIQF